ncbi:unnamed protein product [Candida verbasci]|uniref:Uncharacterized protein n=1 Tax=Candida verbasci TaxID=1227364 RepID=A0A9W4XBD0_9ASCO|nr:unnamed protein product [Candida verbasci]
MNNDISIDTRLYHYDFSPTELQHSKSSSSNEEQFLSHNINNNIINNAMYNTSTPDFISPTNSSMTNNNNSPPFVSREQIIDDEKKFISEHKEHWIHGFNIPYSILKYNLCHDSTAKSKYRGMDSNLQYMFVPKMSLDKVEHSISNRKDSDLSTLSSNIDRTYNKDDDELDADVKHALNKDHSGGAFSGYLNVPRLCVNIPQSFKMNKNLLRQMSDIPKICFQNQFALNDLIYIFGGICVTRFSNFRHLGLPNDIDISKISVEFQYDLPPFIERKILLSPFMQPNTHFVAYNTSRGTVTYLDTSQMKDFPGQFSSMISTQITPRHFFLYGGFKIEDIAIRYVPEIDRWVLKKKIVLNENGFIIDVVTLKFTKILLEKNNDSVALGRLGASICSNIYELHDFRKTIIKEPMNHRATSPANSEKQQPPNSSNSSSLKSNEKQSNSNTSSRSTTEKQSQSNSLHHSSSRSTTEKQSPNDLHQSTSISRTKSQSVSIPETSKTSVNIPEPHKSNTASAITKLRSTTTTNSINTTDSNVSSAASTSSSSSKMSNVLSKSTRIFHRHKHDSNIKSPNPLKHSYSEKVREKRSNSLTTNSGNSSRATSPVPNKQQTTNNITPTPTITPSQSQSTTTQTHPKLYVQTENTIKSSESEVSSDTDSLDLNSQNSPKPYDRREIIEVVRQNKNKENNRASQVFDTASSANSDEEKSEDVLFKDTSSISNISVFIFGGFILDKDGRFIATNDFLKIDLPTKEEPTYLANIMFVNEALVSKIGTNSESCDILIGDDCWPESRGYSAYCLVDNNLMEEACAVDAGEPEMLEPSFQVGGLKRSMSPDPVNGYTKNNSFQIQKSTSVTSDDTVESSRIKAYFDRREFIIQGGCDNNQNFYGDFYRFSFIKCKWEKMTTYAYDYFNITHDGEEDGSLYTKENEIENPILKEAELRGCHHTALYYNNGRRSCLFFVGGVRADLIRFYEKEPYKTDKFNVSTFGRLPISTNNPNLMRVAALDIQTQTWKFMKYFFDTNHALTKSYVEKVTRNPIYTNARQSHIGGHCVLTGKTITVGQGMVQLAPEKRENFEKLKKELPITELLWGGLIQITFPGL